MKTSIFNTFARTLLLLFILVFFPLAISFSCSGKANDEDDTFRQSLDKDLGMDTASGNESTGNSKMAR